MRITNGNALLEVPHVAHLYIFCLLMQFGYLSMEEDKAMALIRKTSDFVYQPPQPRGWSSLGSEKEIEGTWVKDSRTRVRSCLRGGHAT